MLYLAIGFCAALLVAVNLIDHYSPRPRFLIISACLISLIFHPGITMGVTLPTLIYLDLILMVIVLGFGVGRREGRVTFRSSSVLAALVAFAISGLQGCQTLYEYARLRGKYPLVSLEGRLPVHNQAIRPVRLSKFATIRLDANEEELGSGGFRARRLSRLHENVVHTFVNSFGFGVGRGAGMLNPTERNLAVAEVGSYPQPGRRNHLVGSPGGWTPVEPGQDGTLWTFLDDALKQFGDPWKFGDFRDRSHVAGFLPHQVSTVPGPAGDLQVQTIDLVGLLLHDGPIVYESANLPRMADVHAIPVRPLDPFEMVGLESMKGGEDLAVARDGETTRMLGAIRSTKQCLSCHGGERGDLLGAFSYTLRTDKPATSPDKSASR